MTLKPESFTVVASVLLTVLVVAQMLAQASAADKTEPGFGSAEDIDRNRKRLHAWRQSMAKDKSPAECVRMCVKQGMKYALVAESCRTRLRANC